MLESAKPSDLGDMLAAMFEAAHAPPRHADMERLATFHLMGRIAEFYGLSFSEVMADTVPVPDEALAHLFTPHGWQMLGLIVANHYGRGAALMPVSVH